MPQSKGGLPNDVEMLHREMERFIDHVSTRKRCSVFFAPGPWAPPTDVYETGGEIVALIDIAGVDPDSIDVIVEGDILRLCGVRKPLRRGGQQSYYQLEISFGPFQRIIKLPAAVKSDAAQASYRDGFLEIVLPKSPAPQPEQITIKPASQSGS